MLNYYVGPINGVYDKKSNVTFVLYLFLVSVISSATSDFSFDDERSAIQDFLFSTEKLFAVSSSNSSGIRVDNSSIKLQLISVVEQRTEMSSPAPVRHPGQPLHEVVFALPLRDDEKLWSGKVTFTASKPIEVEVLHPFEPNGKIDTKHGEPYHAVLPGNRSIAISHLRNLVDIPIEINGTGISSGTLEFVGSALVFHKTSGEPFTVTYSLDAVAKPTISLD
jgi:hypothetical protein